MFTGTASRKNFSDPYSGTMQFTSTFDLKILEYDRAEFDLLCFKIVVETLVLHLTQCSFVLIDVLCQELIAFSWFPGS
uniref:CUB domain-containing protein n=1 Tax=Ascaris lumbricoides TaxID=6252 RepID=A0A0M3III0_ASCLU